MTERSVVHATFVIKRVFDAVPSRVFAAWADPKAKAKWFGAPDEGTDFHSMDFKLGGKEISRGRGPDGKRYSFDATYLDIVENQRIVYAYDMHLDDERISVSLSTVEIVAAGKGTRLTYTEQGAYLDGLDSPDQREHGTAMLLDTLGKSLEKATA